MITEALGINYYVIGPSLCLLMTGVLFIISDLSLNLKTRYLGIVLTTGIFFTGVTIYLKIGEFARIGLSSHFSSMILLDEFALLGDVLLYFIAICTIPTIWTSSSVLGEKRTEAVVLVLMSLSGFMLMTSSEHYIMLFIGLEIGSISLYALAGLNRKDSYSNEAALKYFLFGSFASAILVYGVALMYTAVSASGVYETSLSIAYIGEPNVPLTAIVGLALFTFGLLFKVSAAPFHAWAPDVYQGAPTGYVGYMAAVVKGASFIVLARMATIVFPLLSLNRSIVFAIISILSVVIGSLFAMTQSDFKRLIAYSGVAQAGLIFSGIASGGVAVIASLFYLVVYMIQLVGLFVVVSIVADGFSSTIDIDQLKGSLKKNPFLGICFSVFLLGLAGMPLTSGFIAKFLLFTNLWAADLYVWVIIFLIASVLGFYFYLKPIWTMSIEEPESEKTYVVSRTNSVVLSVLALLTIIFGVAPSSLLNIANWVLSSYL